MNTKTQQNSPVTGDISSWNVDDIVRQPVTGDISSWNVDDIVRQTEVMPSFESPTFDQWVEAIKGTYQLKPEWQEHLQKIQPTLNIIFDGLPIEAAQYCQEQWLKNQLELNPVYKQAMADMAQWTGWPASTPESS